MNYIQEYVSAIDGGLTVGAKVKKVYTDLLSDIKAGKYDFDESAGEMPIKFAESFCVPKDSKTGKPIKLELFQKAYLQALFGVKMKDGKRRYRESLLLLARKNGKTTLLAIVMLYMLVADNEPGAEVYSVATKLDQARKAFIECVAIVSKSPELRALLKKRQSDIYNTMTYGFIKPLASDSNTLDGLNSHAVIIDELHAIQDPKLYEVMKESMGARTNPLLVMITTAGTVRESIFDQIYQYANNVLNGDVDDEHFLAVMYELDDRAEWVDENKWLKANPGLYTIKQYDYLFQAVKRAKQDISREGGTLTKDFNILGVTDTSWLDYDTVNNESTFDLEDLRGSYAVGGVDLSSTTDLTCATLMVVKDGVKYIIQKYFMPGHNIDLRATEDQVPYDLWVKRGLLHACEGTRVNYTDVTNWFIEMKEVYGIYPLWIGYDSWGSQYWAEEMKAYGFELEVVIQGAKTMSSPMKEMNADLIEKSVNYNNNPVLRWCLTNLSIKSDENDNIRPVKGRNNRKRIDGAVSLIDAYVVYARHKEDYDNMAR